ncbi:hypothetical protein KAR91_25665 [Candidatus Pacearchaeota archaeon]|nr:hypothetical protein [Candidatus Pacearchaeota archaeon]
MKDLKNGICSICGGDEGIHQYETMFCPVGGVEENRYDKLNEKYYHQQWQNTTFVDSGEESLRIDAFRTAQKCGLLPSELLEQRDEMLALLKKMNIHFHSWIRQNKNTLGYEHAKQARELIKKATS